MALVPDIQVIVEETPAPPRRSEVVLVVELPPMSERTRALLARAETRPQAALETLRAAFHGTLAPHHSPEELATLWAEFLSRMHLSGLQKKDD